MPNEEWMVPLDDELQAYQMDAINKVTLTQISDLKKISTLRMSHEWREALSNIHLDRGFKQMDGEMLYMMGVVGASKSEALLHLAKEGKSVGVNLLFRIEEALKSERKIQAVVILIIEDGVKKSRNAVDLILADGEPTANLFNQGEQHGE